MAYKPGNIAFVELQWLKHKLVRQQRHFPELRCVCYCTNAIGLVSDWVYFY